MNLYKVLQGNLYELVFSEVESATTTVDTTTAQGKRETF